MRMYVLIIVAIVIVLAGGLVFLLDRALKAIETGRRRREAGMRLYAAAAQAEERENHRKKNENQSKALTTVLPAIFKTDKPRKVA